MSQTRSLIGKVALVTGASRGIGRGIALQLGEAGATVYVTGRRPEASFNTKEFSSSSLEKTANDIKQRGGESVLVYCDHGNTEDIKNLFAKINEENKGSLDILVNNAFSGVQNVVNVAGKKFFECEPELWDEMNDVGLRSNYICSIYGARLMTKKRTGLIINISSAGGLQYFFNIPYGVGKAAIDRMSADMAFELKPWNITVVSLWPGFVNTEFAEKTLNSNSEILAQATGLNKDLLQTQWRNSESPEFVGKAVVALALDKKVLKKTGKILITTDLADEYKFKDINGLLPTHFRSVQSALQFLGFEKLAKFVPSFLKIPKFILHFVSYKF